MKKRTKEEQAAYMKAYRSRNVTPTPVCVTPSCNTHVTPVVNVTPGVTPRCESCDVLRVQIKKLIAENAMLKLQVEKKVSPVIVQDTDRAYDGGVALPKYKPLGNSYKPNSLYGA